MRLLERIIFILLLTITFSQMVSEVTDDPVQILSITTDVNQLDLPQLKASKYGGQQLFLKVTGLDQTPSNNQVTIGPHPCVISEKGIGGLYLTCETVDVTTSSDTWGQKVQVWVKGKRVSSCLAKVCSVHLTEAPQIQQIYPRDVYPTMKTTWQAYINSEDKSVIKTMKIGDTICDRFQDEKEESDTYFYRWGGLVNCQVSADLVAGYYSAKLKNFEGWSGTSIKQPSVVVSTGQVYQIKSLPLVRQLSTNQISPEGLRLKVTGNGFGDVKENVSVQYAGLQAKVLSVKPREIEIEIPKLGTTDLTESIGKFTGGSGLRYTVYKKTPTTDNIANFRNQILDGTYTGVPIDDGIYTNPESSKNYGINVQQYVRGFFIAPRTGNYRFYTVGITETELWLGKVPNSVLKADQQMVNQAGYSSGRNYWQHFFDRPDMVPNSISSPITLQAGQKYYLQYFQNTYYYHPGYSFTLSVEIPSDTQQFNSINDIQKIEIKHTGKLEIIQYKVYNTAENKLLDGTYRVKEPGKLYYTIDKTSDNFYHKWSNSVDSLWGQLKWKIGWQTTIVRAPLNNLGQVIPDTSVDVAGYQYTVTFTWHRGIAVGSLPEFITTATVGSVKCEASIIQLPDSPITGGYYKLQLDGKFLKKDNNDQLPWNIQPWELASAINSLYPTCETNAWTQGSFADGIAYYFVCRDIRVALPEISINQNMLISGKPTTITGGINSPRSKSQLFEPMPSELIALSSNTPQIKVTVNNILGVCLVDTCKLQPVPNANVPIISSFTQSGTTLTVNYANPANFQFTRFDLSITFGGANCDSITLTATSITCNLPSINSSPVIEAGNNLPRVHITQLGYMVYSTTVAAKTQTLTISSISPNKGSLTGGTQVTINGSGFPISNQPERYTLLVNSAPLKVISVTNKQIIAITPKQQIDNLVTLNFNGLTATIAFTYDLATTVQLTSMSSQTASPYSRDTMTITGNNFGTSTSALKVQLRSVANTYDTKVVSVTNTLLTIKLQGGRAGKYDLVVNRVGWGDSYPATETADDFTLQTLVTGLSPKVGSIGGGTLLTISGQNFDTIPGNTLVIIGNVPNWICEVTSITSTQIVCKAPLMHTSVSPYQPQTINVITRLQDYAVISCSDCKFTYTNENTPQVTLGGRRILIEEQEDEEVKPYRFLFDKETKERGPNHLMHFLTPYRSLQSTDPQVPNPTTIINYQGSSSTTTIIKGSGFGTSPILLIGDIKLSGTQFKVQNDTYIEFLFPFIPAGYYVMRVEVPGKGYSPAWKGYVQLNAWNIEYQSATVEVSQGGQQIQLSGSGLSVDPKNPTLLDAMLPGSPDVYVASLKCVSLFNNWSNQLLCNTPRLATPDVEYKLKFQSIDPKSLSVQFPSWVNLRFKPTVAKTPIIKSVTSTSITSGLGNLEFPFTIDSGADFTLKLSGLQFPITTKLKIYFTNSAQRNVSEGVVQTATANEVVVRFTNVEAGYLKLNVLFNDKVFGFFETESFQSLMIKMPNPTATTIQSSYLGGQTLQITGVGFSEQKDEIDVRVCGIPCPVIAASKTGVSCEVPPFATENTQQYYNVNADYTQILKNSYSVKTDTLLNANTIQDNLQTTYYSSTNSECFVQFDFGDNNLKLHHVMYFPRVDFDPNLLLDTQFQISRNGKDFTTVNTINSLIHSGWNYFVPETPIVGIQSIRFYDPTGKSKCQMAELQLYGWLSYAINTPLTENKSCTARVSVNGVNPSNAYDAVVYSAANTPVVQTVLPLYGPSNGGTTLTITGNNFVASSTVVKVDGVICIPSLITATQITCKTGNRDTSTTRTKTPSFEVTVNGNRAAIFQSFFYANRFSDEATWGGDIPPREMDSILVPAGETLIIDKTPPKLFAIIVEGALIFSDEADLELHASYVIIRDGTFQAGTEKTPKTKKLAITLYGNIEDKQLPDLGNKVIACHSCTLDIHGERRSLTWTELGQTAEKGAKSITLISEVDWRVGEEFVIASTGWNHLESERRIIKTIGTDKKTITFDQELQYRHYSAVETYGTKQFPMRAEVGLLTRNIVIQGDSNSEQYQYGAHLMIHGSMNGGVKGRIEYAEFRQVGQPRIIGRYPIHFHLNGEMFDSYVIGNSIHDSFARCVTIHGTHFLKVSNNVGYNHFGHGIFMEDGIETNNIITGNLIMGGKQSWIMLQKDITVSTYWITHPYNTVTDNRSGGSEWYGFWYEIKEHPDGPSARSDICPQGIELKKFSNNIAHSNGKYGLRILEMAPRRFPCLPARNELAADVFGDNPAIWSVFENFITFKNHEVGVLGEFLGNIKFVNIMVADSKLAGFQSHLTNRTRDGAMIDNYLIVGKSQGNAESDAYYFETRAIIAPRTNGFTARNVQIYNFGSNMILFQSCSRCFHQKVWVTGGKNTKFEKIYVDSSASSASLLFWENWRREIFWDLDGSITGLGPSYLTPYKPHLDGVDGCTRFPQYNDSLVCLASKTEIRDVLINNPMPQANFQGVPMKIARVIQSTQTLTPFTDEGMIIIKMSNDLPASFATPLATGHTYHIQFNQGIDFDHLGIIPSHTFQSTDKGFVLRFNYLGQRESFDITRLKGKTRLLSYTNIGSKPDPNTCENGQWWNDKDNKLLYICFSGKSKLPEEYVDVNPVICSGSTCMNGIKEPTKETFLRYWSDVNNWGGALPVAGANVNIPGSWQLVLDVDTPVLGNIIVDGYLIFSDTKPLIQLQAKNVWIRIGKIIAGTSDKPYQNQARILLYGARTDSPMVVSEFVQTSSKSITITNGIQLYGKVPTTVWTRLSAFAKAGQNVIQLLEAGDWKVGDELAIGPSGNIPSQHEKVKISAISGTSVTLTTALKYNHYGALTKTLGDLDMRAVVAHLTRNVQVQGVAEATNWGCRIMVTQFNDTIDGVQVVRRGYAQIQGVEFSNCGQQDTTQGALDFRYLNFERARTLSQVKGNSFHSSNGPLFNAIASHDILVENNVFYNGIRFLASMVEGMNNKFKNNALIYVQQRQLEEFGLPNWAVLGNFVSEQNYYTIDQIEVTGNVGQGSEDAGFFFMATPCDQADKNGFYKNTVSSCASTGFGFRQSNQNCQIIKDNYVFHTYKGIMASMNTDEIRVEGIIAAENRVGVLIRPGTSDDYDNPMSGTGWVVTALARPDCVDCYNANFGDICQNQIAFEMGTVSITAFPPPLTNKKAIDINKICKVQKVDGKVYMNKIVFSNYKPSYTGLANCKNNNVFRQNYNADDMTASHYLTQTRCDNCDKNSLFSFFDPNIDHRGWFGGCGSFDCTGQWNVLVHDQDGSFLGTPKQVISNNQQFANFYKQCTKIPAWNGYECNGENIAVLNWMDITADYNQRLFSPVYLKQNGLLINKINSLREWSWDGPEPLNTRESKFIGLVPLYTVIDMENSGMNSQDMVFWIQKRLPLGKDTDWVIIRLTYQTPQSLQVLIDRTIIQPYPVKKVVDANGVTTNVGQDLTMKTTICGANNYYSETNTIEFVVTGNAKCIVRVRQVNNIMLNMHLNLDYDSFLSNDKFGSFANKIAAFLDIDPNRIKVVGHARGSLKVQVSVDRPNAAGAANTVTGEYDYKVDQQEQTSNVQTITVKKTDLVNNFESLKSISDPPLTMNFESIQQNVAMNVHYETTEKPPSSSADLLFNRSKFGQNQENHEKENSDVIYLYGLLSVATLVGVGFALAKWQKKRGNDMIQLE